MTKTASPEEVTLEAPAGSFMPKQQRRGSDTRRRESPDGESWLSWSTFAYAWPVISKVIKLRTEVELSDLPSCPASDNPKLHAARMRALLQAGHSDVWSYLRFIWPTFRWGVLFSLFSCTSMFVQPLANMKIVEVLQKHADGEPYDVNAAYLWACIGGAQVLFLAGFGQHSMMMGKFSARRAYAAYSRLVFEKPALVTSSALGVHEEGQILNMMSVDCLSIVNVTLFLQFSSARPSALLKCHTSYEYFPGWKFHATKPIIMLISPPACRSRCS